MQEQPLPSRLCVVCNTAFRLQQATTFAKQLHIPLLKKKSTDHALQLLYDDDKITLYDTELNAATYVDFVDGALAHRQQFGGGRGQAIARAMGIKKGRTPSILDVTAGLARDAYILATLGCEITLVEQSPVLVTLIKDGIYRGLQSADSAEVLKDNLRLFNADAIEHIKTLAEDGRPDVVYMDPMYPERKKSALVKKDMRILQRLVGKDGNTQELLEIALNCARHRVVVKRPIHAKTVSDIKPSTQICSKKTRYDIYVTK